MFKHYLEYLTQKERERAFKAGQTNLDPKLREAEQKVGFIKEYKMPRWFNKYLDDDENFIALTPIEQKKHFKKNTLPTKNGTRIIMLRNGDFIINNPHLKLKSGYDNIHTSILAYIIMNGLDKGTITQREYNEWSEMPPRKFICLIFFNYYDKNEADWVQELQMAESYHIYIDNYPNLKKFWSKLTIEKGLGKILR